MSPLWKLIEIRSKVKIRVFKRFCSLVIIPILSLKGSYIPSGTRFENKPTFPHGISGIFISDGTYIGKDAVIFHQVTIGSNTLANSEKRGSPVIGDNCYIGAGAKIIGNIKIGNNVRIGVNCVVVKDIPDNCTVVNQPSRLIMKESKTDNKYRGIRS